MKFRSHTLDNGLEIVAECNDTAHSVGLGFFVRTGARDETDEVAGVSHFLEHMVFKGTPRRSADDVNREFDELGAHYNAFTSEENTVYYASVLPEYQEGVIDILADIMRPSLREEDFDMEKKVIIEEIQMYADQPPFGMDDKIKELHYGLHPLARSVLGTEFTVGELAVEQMRDYFESRYASDNLFVAAAGKVDFDALVKQVESRCGQWKPALTVRDLPPYHSHSSFQCVARPASTQQYVLQLADAPAAEDDRRFAAKLLATMFGDDSGSRLYWELVDPGIVESASTGHYEYQGAGMYFSWLSCAPKDAAENYSRMSELQGVAQQQGFTEQELHQAKSKVKARVVLGSERPRNRLFNVGGNWLQRREYRSVADDLKALEAVTINEIEQVLTDFPLTRHTTVTIGPLESWPT
ncbi:M16 family metallopeptidase [Bythopirellula polymerisocia]|uniref:Protease 3 n=1 Tax=Bythopirellula polymerisocia TaxID=2528003 RepID=A0A5C6CEZ0_9BACT|nr:pitrilysin family protein [Bythopirellula polymerisocia]TWU22838.1 Protease 3 precursor [Bythopirellula polymerisocia]